MLGILTQLSSSSFTLSQIPSCADSAHITKLPCVVYHPAHRDGFPTHPLASSHPFFPLLSEGALWIQTLKVTSAMFKIISQLYHGQLLTLPFRPSAHWSSSIYVLSVIQPNWPPYCSAHGLHVSYLDVAACPSQSFMLTPYDLSGSQQLSAFAFLLLTPVTTSAPSYS